MNALVEELRIALHAVWLRRWLALGVAWGLCLLGWLVIALIPNSYESSAKVVVQTQTILPGKVGITPGEQARDIERVRQTLTSAANLEKVVRGTTLARKAVTDADVAAAIANLRESISVRAQQDNLFEVSAVAGGNGLSDAENARLARAIVQKLIDIFVEENLTGDRAEASQTLRFLDAELARRERQLRAAEERRMEFERKFMGLLPGIGSIEQRLETARVELVQVDQSLAAAQGSLAALNGQMASTPAAIPIAGGGGGGGGARGRIAALEGQLSDATAKGWTEQHPDVVATRAQIARLRGPAAREGGGGGGSTANPLHVTLRSMQAEKQATVGALAARKAQLQADMAAFAAKQAEEPGAAAEQARVTRDYEVLKLQYDKLLADREDVRLRADVTAKTDAVKFSVLEPPAMSAVPVAPNRPLLLAGVLILGIAAGIGVAFAQGQLRPTFATAGQLARISGFAVIGQVSEVVNATTGAERIRHLKWFAGGVGALAASFVLLLAVEFVQRGLVA